MKQEGTTDAVDPLTEDLAKALVWHALLRTGALDVNGGRVDGAVPLVYIDKNPWGRHADDSSLARNAAEAQAFELLRNLLRRGEVRLTYSSISFGEGSPRSGAPSASRAALLEVIGLKMGRLPIVSHDKRADTDAMGEFLFRRWGIAGSDAIHAAAALLEGAWYFVTGDDTLRKRLNRAYEEWVLPASAETPVTVLQRLAERAPI